MLLEHFHFKPSMSCEAALSCSPAWCEVEARDRVLSTVAAGAVGDLCRGPEKRLYINI